MVATVSDASSDFKKPGHSGPYGNASVFSGNYIPGAVKGVTGDTVQVDICKLPAGSQIDQVLAVFTALGTAASMKIGFRWENTDPALFVPTGAPTPAIDYFKGATDVSGAGSAVAYFKPVYLPIPAVLTITVDSSSGSNILPNTADIYVRASGVSRGV
jgi:hypothetical protein